MHSGGSTISNNPAFTISIDIASLVLEGRPLCEDEYNTDDSDTTNNLLFLQTLRRQHAQRRAALEQQQQHASQLKNNTVQDGKWLSDYVHQREGGSCQDAQRLRQKLIALRSLPSTSRDVGQSIAISSVQPTNAYDSDDDADFPQNQSQNSSVESHFLNSLQSLAETCLKTTPRSFNKTYGLLRTVEAFTSSGGGFIAPSLAPKIPSHIQEQQSTSSSTKKLEKQTKKQVGPHCEQFLKKIGLIKVPENVSTATATTATIPTSPTAAATKKVTIDIDEHLCDENENVSCFNVI